MKLVFATHNNNKLEEIRSLLPERIELLSLTDIGCYDPIEEYGKTLEENAWIKARYVREHHGLDCFSDDSGLEVKSLHGAPGVISARYAGDAKNANKNMEKLLTELQGLTDRSAQFRTVIALTLNNVEKAFEGIVKGTITQEKSGNGGFGYDPIFCPEGYEKTFAALTLEEKNKISHRSRAFQKLLEYLKHS